MAEEPLLPALPPMSDARAAAITRRVCEAWFVMHGLSGSVMPDLSGITLPEARQAAAVVRASPREVLPDGSTVVPTTVDDSALPLVLSVARRAHSAKITVERAVEVTRRVGNARLNALGIPGPERNLDGISLEEAEAALPVARRHGTVLDISRTVLISLFETAGADL